jgi:EAL domain-containing protein (putative c-di-GMP-specific phosphodiesterase class I)
MSVIPLREIPQRLIPRIEESLDDCGYLFTTFRENLQQRGCIGIVALYLAYAQFPNDAITRSVALFIRIMEKKLAGKISGGYQAGAGEFFLLLVPQGEYNERLFQRDMEIIRQELRRHFALPPLARRIVPLGGDGDVTLGIEGVFLANRVGETVDNALFRAFQELFGSSSSPLRHKSLEQAELEEIITGGMIASVFQPIFSLQDSGIYGYEALSRVSSPGAVGPEELFARAGRYGLAYHLDMLCRRKALTRARILGLTGKLFINVCPTVLLAKEHEPGITAALLEGLQIERARIVFELTEQTLINDYALFHRALSHYRDQGYSIAIDDLGSGYAGLKMLAELEPEYVKLARFLVAGIDTSTTRQLLVEALVNFCAKIGATVIAEGIERREELEFLVSAGVHLGQGYLLAKPSPLP